MDWNTTIALMRLPSCKSWDTASEIRGSNIIQPIEPFSNIHSGLGVKTDRNSKKGFRFAIELVSNMPMFIYLF